MGATVETSWTWTSLLSTTLAKFRPVLHDNIFKDLVLLFWLNEAGKKRMEDGGSRVEETLLYAKNTTAKNYSGYELLDTTPQEGITKAYYDWKQASVSITISRKEERQNSGRSQVLNLLKGKTLQAELTLKDLLNQQLIGDASSETRQQDGSSESNPKYFSGMARFVQDVPANAHTVGGIAQGTEAWWRNQATDFNGASVAWATFGLKRMATTYNLCSEGNDHPDLLLGDRETYEEYEALLESSARYIDKRFGNGGFTNLRFKGAPYTYDSWFESMATPQIFSTDTGRIYFLNSKYISWVVDQESDFMTTPFVRPENQDARTAQILLMAEMVSANRRRLGVMFECGTP